MGPRISDPDRYDLDPTDGPTFFLYEVKKLYSSILNPCVYPNFLNSHDTKLFEICLANHYLNCTFTYLLDSP